MHFLGHAQVSHGSNLHTRAWGSSLRTAFLFLFLSNYCMLSASLEGKQCPCERDTTSLHSISVSWRGDFSYMLETYSSVLLFGLQWKPGARCGTESSRRLWRKLNRKPETPVLKAEISGGPWCHRGPSIHPPSQPAIHPSLHLSTHPSI